jgi:hypothetical protein
MIRKPFIAFSLAVALAVMLAGFSQTHRARAQTEAPDTRTKCRTCHEDLYYLYDTGQWYCLCRRQRTCSDCHAGNPDTRDVKLAHEGMVGNPIAENPAICQDCHPEDARARIEQFSQIAGIDPAASLAPTHTPDTPWTAGSQGITTLSPLLRTEPMETWRMAALGLLGFAFLGILIFGYRCWKADCLANKITARS